MGHLPRYCIAEMSVGQGNDLMPLIEAQGWNNDTLTVCRHIALVPTSPRFRILRNTDGYGCLFAKTERIRRINGSNNLSQNLFDPAQEGDQSNNRIRNGRNLFYPSCIWINIAECGFHSAAERQLSECCFSGEELVPVIKGTMRQDDGAALFLFPQRGSLLPGVLLRASGTGTRSVQNILQILLYPRLRPNRHRIRGRSAPR